MSFYLFFKINIIHNLFNTSSPIYFPFYYFIKYLKKKLNKTYFFAVNGVKIAEPNIKNQAQIIYEIAILYITIAFTSGAKS